MAERKTKPVKEYTIELRDRKAGGDLYINRDYVRALDKESDEQVRDTLFEIYEQAKDNNIVNDKRWLKQIIDTGPPKGLSVTQQAPWFDLALRLDDMGDEKTIILSQKDVNRIFRRLNNDDIKFGALPVPFIRFILELSEVTDKDLDSKET